MTMLYASPHVGVTIPAVGIADFVFKQANSYPDKAAIIDGATHRVLTYAALLEEIRRMSDGLARLGVQKGDVVAVYGPNSPDYIIAFYAVTSLGAIITSLNPLHNVAELSYQLMDAAARLLIVTCEVTPALRRAAERAGAARVLTLDETKQAHDASADVGRPLTSAALDARCDVASLTYSGAMSDVPMGVMLTHHNIVANLVQMETVQPVTATEVVIGLTPFCHMYGMAPVNLGLHAGATVVSVPQFSLQALLEAMDRYRVTAAYLIPAVIRTLAKHPLVAQHDLSALRHITAVTAPLPKAVGRACTERLGCTISQAYGLTHAVAFTHITARDFGKDPSVGLPLPLTECRIVDVASRQAVTGGTLGEVCVRGPQVMKGLHNYPEITADLLDDGGWLHTGDIGYCDAEGYLYVIDRSKKLVRLRQLHRHDEKLLRAAVEDLGARQEATERLNLQSVLLDSVRESVVSTDLENNVIFWNKGAEHLFGYSAQEAVGKQIASLIAPEGQTLDHPDKTLALRSRGTWNAHVRRRRRDGSVMWTDLVVSIVRNASGERVGFIGIYRDITEHRLVEQRLRFQAQLLDSVRESVVATDPGGRITYWGKGAEALFGYRAGEMLGEEFAPLAFPSAAVPVEEFRRVKDEVLALGQWSGRSVPARRRGSTFWADVTLAPVLDDVDKPVGVIAIHRDIGELRRNQELVRESHERTRNLAARLMVVREHERSLIARELHDELGQALTRLSIDLSALQERQPQHIRAKRIHSMGRLVDTTLKSVQQISSQLRPPVLDDLGLEAAIEWHVQEFSEWSGCRCDIDLRLGTLPRNKDRDIAIYRIVQEALTNVARHARAEHVLVRASAEAEELLLEIEDDGIGIPEGKLRSPHSLGIIGMGERAEGLGGEIHIAPRAGGGTIVTLRLGVSEHRLWGAADYDPVIDSR